MVRSSEAEGILAISQSAEVRRFAAAPNTGVYVVRHDGDIVWASASMKQATGRSPEDLLGLNGWDVFVPPEDFAEVARFKAGLSGGDGVVWMRLRTPEGGTAWYRVECGIRSEFIVCAFKPERDPARHHLHWEYRPRRA